MARIKYIMRDGWRLIWRHFGMSLLTIFTAMAVFFVVGATMLFILNMRSVIANMENQLSIQAYLRADAELEKTAAAVRGIRGVESVTMITKETALERLRARLGNQADAVMLLGENPLPASLEIHVAKASQVADVASRLTSVKEIEDIVYAGHVAEKLTRLSSFVEKFSIIMLAVALTASGVVLFNTIRISVYSRAQEIDVMMKVGTAARHAAVHRVHRVEAAAREPLHHAHLLRRGCQPHSEPDSGRKIHQKGLEAALARRAGRW